MNDATLIETGAAGAVVKAPKVIIATGARPAVPAIPGIDTIDYLTSTSALDLEVLR